MVCQYRDMKNPLDDMTWEERFVEAWKALIVSEGKLARASEQLRSTKANLNIAEREVEICRNAMSSYRYRGWK